MSHRTSGSSAGGSAGLSTSAIPAAAILDRWTGAEWTGGCQLDRLVDMQPLTVITCNSLYEIFVLAGLEGRIRIRGGQFFPEWTEAILAGATLGGSFLKVRGVYTGFCVELHAAGEIITTSPVRRVTLARVGGDQGH